MTRRISQPEPPVSATSRPPQWTTQAPEAYLGKRARSRHGPCPTQRPGPGWADNPQLWPCADQAPTHASCSNHLHKAAVIVLWPKRCAHIDVQCALQASRPLDARVHLVEAVRSRTTAAQGRNDLQAPTLPRNVLPVLAGSLRLMHRRDTDLCSYQWAYIIGVWDPATPLGTLRQLGADSTVPAGHGPARRKLCLRPGQHPDDPASTKAPGALYEQLPAAPLRSHRQCLLSHCPPSRRLMGPPD